METRKGGWIQTWEGIAFYVLDPRPEEIYIEDIARALSMQCRYTGHVRFFYSVAEHCCHIADRCTGRNKAWGLLHDASEAYLNDIARPVKPDLANYKIIEAGVMACVIDRFNLPLDMPQEVHDLDNRILVNEREQLLKKPPMPWMYTGERILDLMIEGWHPQQAEAEFMWRFKAYVLEGRC